MSPPERPLALPRGVASPEGTLGFVRNAHDGIDALRLDAGALVWRSGVAAEPVAATELELVAARPSAELPSALELVVLSVPDQGRVLRECRLVLPEGVVAAGGQRDFRSSVTLEGRTLRLEWRARTRYRGGAPPPEAMARAARGELQGVLRCDLETGAVTTEGPPHPVTLGLPPSLPYRVRSVWSEWAWSQGDGLASLALAGSAGARELVLELRSAAESPPRTVALSHGEAFDVQVTPEGRYVFVRLNRPPSSEWSVFAAATGRRVASLPYLEDSQWPCVVGARAYYLVTGPGAGAGAGLLLESADLSAGQALWRHDLGRPVRSPAPLPR